MQLTKDQVTNEAQSAIMTVFAEDFKDTTKADNLVCNSVVNADDDAGEWSREAMVIIYHVNGMPSINRIDEWGKVSDILYDYYVEAINPEVSAIYSL